GPRGAERGLERRLRAAPRGGGRALLADRSGRAGRRGHRPPWGRRAPPMKATHHGAIIAAGILLGTGLGGFVDGILFHQILQWHNMLSSARPPVDLVSMKYNMVWDGLFHAFTWTMTSLGLARLWLAGSAATSRGRRARSWARSLSAGACSTSSKGRSTTS